MKHLVILGHGTGGTIIAAKMRQKLAEKDWRDNRYRPGLAAPLPARLALYSFRHLHRGGLRQAQDQICPSRGQPWSWMK